MTLNKVHIYADEQRGDEVRQMRKDLTVMQVLDLTGGRAGARDLRRFSPSAEPSGLKAWGSRPLNTGGAGPR